MLQADGCGTVVGACGADVVCAAAAAVACDVAVCCTAAGAMEGTRDMLAGVRLKDGRVVRYGIC